MAGLQQDADLRSRHPWLSHGLLVDVCNALEPVFTIRWYNRDLEVKSFDKQGFVNRRLHIDTLTGEAEVILGAVIELGCDPPSHGPRKILH